MLLIDNIGTLITMMGDEKSPLGEIDDAAMLIDKEHVHWCGKKTDLSDIPIEKTVDARGCLVVPGLIDCHSHLIFAGSRADEFARRMRGERYEEIMKMGGGIMATVRATRNASDEELLKLAHDRADRIISKGVTTLEAKSGYGLSHKEEIRTLSLLQKINNEHILDIHPTFLGAHVIPQEFARSRERYISSVLDMLDQVAAEKLAVDCDVFCESGAFSYDESLQILKRAYELGLGLRAHAQQLSLSGGVSLIDELPIKSISHADFLSEEDIEKLSKKKTVVEALPIAALFLRSERITPVEKLRYANVPLAIATDFNPGSAMCDDLVLAARLGVGYFRFTVEDALCAITINAARSLGRSDIGVLKAAGLADILITNCTSISEFFYDWTKHPARTVIKRGQLVYHVEML